MVAAAVAAGSAAAGLAGSALSSSAANSAAKTSANAQLQAAQLQQAQNQQNIANLAPYNANGQASLPLLNAQYGQTQNALSNAFNNAQSAVPVPMTQAQLVNTPGYQFNLAQGLQSTQASAAARGLGVSGAALKGAAQYSTGLANQTYAQQLANQNTIYQAQNQQFSNAYNGQNALYQQALGPASLGENAAAQSGYQSNQAAANIGNNIAGAGGTLAAGQAAGANALANGISSAGNSGFTYLALNNALNNNNAAGSIPAGGSGMVPGGQGGGFVWGNET